MGLFSVGAPEVVATKGSFLTPSQISFSILKRLPSSTTRTSDSCSSCTVPQNASGGTQAHMVHHWSTGPAQHFLPSTSLSNPGSGRGLWAQGTPSFSVLPGRVGWAWHHALSYEWLVGGKLQLVGRPYSWLGHHCSAHLQRGLRGQNSSHHSGIWLSLFKKVQTHWPVLLGLMSMPTHDSFLLKQVTVGCSGSD